jgi:hypothetical protein
MFTKRFAVAAVILAVAAALALPATVLAQARGGAPPPSGRGGGAPPPVHVGGGPVHGGPVHAGGPRVVVGVGWGYGYGPWGPYGAWGYGYGPWGPWGPWGGWGWGGPCCYYDYMYASARIQVQPKQTEVFVDGYRAGIVDDFDGIFQRLNVWPGEHEITLYLEGYATERHQIYMAQGTTANLKGVLEKLPDGKISEPPPKPAPRQPPQEGQGGRGRPANPPPQPEPPTVEIQQEAVRFGAVSIRIAPADAVIVIDEQTWTGPGADQRLNVQLASGRHHIEVRKDGFVTYAEDVLIRAGATLTLNVNLSRK